MADLRKGKFSSSPKEDYNPLSEDRLVVPGNVATSQSSDRDADSDSSSDDNETRYDSALNSLENILEDDIPFSPPSSSRLVKREKIRRNSSKGRSSTKDHRASMSAEKNKRPKTVVSVIKERYVESNALFSGLAHNDSDVDLERETNRESKEKRKKEREDKLKSKTRQQEIYEKRHSHHDMNTITENIMSNTAPMGISTPVVPVTLEGSGRYPSFGFGPQSKILPVSPVAPEKVERRQTVTSSTNCPTERLTFYKTFQALINMGSHGKKHKEEKAQILAQRQKSSDEQLYINCVWIGLQAWLNGLPPNEQEDLMLLEREKIPQVIKWVMDFRVQIVQLNVSNMSLSDQEIPGSGTDDAMKNRDSSCSIDTGITDISQTYHTMSLSTEMIEQQQQAVIQVQKILEKLDRCEQLFPTSRQFAEEYSAYRDPAFVRRTEALYLWLNTTKDLCHKLNVLGQVLNISQVPGFCWPYVDFNSGDTGSAIDKTPLRTGRIPEIVRSEGKAEEGGEYDNDEDADEGDVYSSDCENNGQNELRASASSINNGQEAGKRVSFQFFDHPRSPSSPLTSPKRDRSPNFGSPPDASTPLRAHFSSATSLSRASSEASLDDICRSSVYRAYVEKGLKKMGLNKMLIRLRDILYRSLRRARQSLEQQHGDAESMVKSPSDDYYHSPLAPTLDLLDKSMSVQMESHTPQELHAWRQEFLEIGLPSYRPTYIFLLQVLLEVIHEAMKIRLEQLQNPIGEPSFLSIRQLIIECKDVLAKAVLVKRDYQCMVQAVLDDQEAMAENSPLDLETFDDDMSSMFKMYFQYLQNWLYHLQNLPEASRTLKIPLEEEWSFTKKICPHIIGGEAEAGKRFSTMAISLLNSISDFLESGIDDCLKYLFDWTMHDTTSSEEGEGDSDDEHDSSIRRSKSATGFRRSSQKTCRLFKNLFHEARERASKALGFAKLLRKDLEIAADFNVAVQTSDLLLKLKESDHINVIAQMSAGYLMFIPARIAEQRRHIIQLLNVTCGREDVSGSSDYTFRDDGYLLMVRCGSGTDLNMECPLWDGPSIQVEPTAETAIALSHIQVESLLLVVIHSSHLANQRKEFENLMGNTVELVNEQTSCHQVIAESLVDLKESAISLRDKVATVISQVEEHWQFDKEMDEGEKKHILKLYRETMLQAYNFGFEYMKEVTRLVSGETRSKLGRGLMLFAKDWMKFVSEKCERGRGMRPRWANQGLDFLLIACEPKILATLTEQEYQELQEGLNEFITHLIGNADKASHFGGPLPMPRHSSGDISRGSYSRYPSWPASHVESRIPRTQSTRSMQDPTSPQSAPAAAFNTSNPQIRTIQSTPSLDSSDTPDFAGMKKRSSESNVEVDIHDGDDGGIVMEVRNRHRASDSGLCASHNVFSYNPHTRMVSAINKLEQDRQRRQQDDRVIGRVTKHMGVNYHINTKKVNFHWQKGIKIGEGQFGKVYSAVNMDNGELMAMKEMKFPSADMQHHFREIIDEIKIFEGINHPNLVKYYGVEVHRTEMLVFMEYCDRGTIDDVSHVGLTEDLIRIYTKQLLKAVQVLHDNKIVHRDIKGANIFLMSSGRLKLGDFGCSVKLKNHTTMAGEVNALVGTTAYMAPEVITRNSKEGHGRAADIWSVGCVVIEMVSGKRPWHELDSKFQIMFKLGMGETPAIPENLQEEGKDFLQHCLEQDPSKRWTSSQLLDHPFAKIYDPDGDEDADTSQV